MGSKKLCDPGQIFSISKTITDRVWITMRFKPLLTVCTV